MSPGSKGHLFQDLFFFRARTFFVTPEWFMLPLKGYAESLFERNANAIATSAA